MSGSGKPTLSGMMIRILVRLARLVQLTVKRNMDRFPDDFRVKAEGALPQLHTQQLNRAPLS